MWSSLHRSAFCVPRPLSPSYAVLLDAVTLSSREIANTSNLLLVNTRSRAQRNAALVTYKQCKKIQELPRVIISQSRTPNDQTSDLVEYSEYMSDSGAIQRIGRRLYQSYTHISHTRTHVLYIYTIVDKHG